MSRSLTRRVNRIGYPTEIKVDAPLDMIPVYLRPGAVLPVQLNRELQFGQSISRGRVSALVVTPLQGNESVSTLNAQGQAGKVTVQSRPQGCSWKLENFPETSYLLVYGANSAAKVKVDGKVASRITGIAFSAMAAGWQADRAGDRLVICLASARVNRPARTIEVELGPGKN
jgi:hypothetical protein